MLIALFATLLACSTASSDAPVTSDAAATESVMPASQDQSATQLDAAVAPCSDIADDGHCLDAQTSEQVPSTAIPVVADPAAAATTVVVTPDHQ